MKINYVDTPAGLGEAAASLAGAAAIAVDTEFFWEHTYYPQLGLVQIAGESGDCWLLDTVRLDSLAPIAGIFLGDATVKVLHDSTQDLAILERVFRGAPRNCFDTRLAAGFAGLPSTLSLQKLVAELCGVDLPKEETRSNWIRRPLRSEQLRYAADDVAYLLEAREKIVARCADDEVRSWLAEEMSSLPAAQSSFSRVPRDAWRRVSRFGVLDPRHLAVLRELAAWREECARSRDVPRGRWASDELLVELSARAPKDSGELGSISGVPRTWLRDRRGSIVLDCIARGMDTPQSELPSRPGQPPIDRDTLRARTAEIRKFIDTRATARGIDPAVVAARADIESLVIDEAAGHDTSAHPLRSGWRAALLSAPSHA